MVRADCLANGMLCGGSFSTRLHDTNRNESPTGKSPMSTPVSPQKAPYGLDLDPGTYYWCACGRSRNQPFCDGSHKLCNFQAAEAAPGPKTMPTDPAPPTTS